MVLCPVPRVRTARSYPHTKTTHPLRGRGTNTNTAPQTQPQPFLPPHQTMYYLANPDTNKKVVEQDGRYWSESEGK
jgi:hypothetical protein